MSAAGAAIRLLVIALAALTAGCGFQLRGSGGDLEPLSPLFVRDAADAALAPTLIEALRASGARLSPSAAEARTVLVLEQEQQTKRLSVVGDQGQALEYELNYRIRFRVEDGSGETLLEPQTVGLSRDQALDRTRPLSISAEEEAIREEMRQEAAYLVIQRLRGLKPASA